MQELIKMQKQIEEIHTLVKNLAKQRVEKEERLTAEQVAERAKLSINTIKAYTQRKKIKSRQMQPGEEPLRTCPA